MTHGRAAAILRIPPFRLIPKDTTGAYLYGNRSNRGYPLNEPRAVEDTIVPAAALHEGLINFVTYRGMTE